MRDFHNFTGFTAKTWFKQFGGLVRGRPLNRSSMDILCRLAGTNESLSPSDIRQVYYPLATLILRAFHHHQLQNPHSLFIVGISGSVAVGKSTGARLLTELLRREEQSIELITSDNFLKPNTRLEVEGLLKRKGFPESYDQEAIVQFVNDIRNQKSYFTIPTYDHIAYTILPNTQTISRPKLLILEGVNVLRDSRFPLDYRLYFDADKDHIETWYVRRFLTFRSKAFCQPGAYFERFADLTDQEATQVARDLWSTINLKNLEEHILPGRTTADCIVHKNKHHKVDSIHLKDTSYSMEHL